MPNSLVRTLYVGVGGPGVKAVIQAKSYFAEVYGKDKIPPVVAFLAIDTDGGVPNDDPVVKLEPDEMVSISVQDPRKYYNNNADAFTWLPEENVKSMTRMTRGAGQVRTNGRFAMTINHQTVKSRISQAVAKISDATAETDGSWVLDPDEDIRVHMIFSICGGTGCGSFINLAYIIKSAISNCRLSAYAVLPDVFRGIGGSMALVGANAYGALTDLDYLMTMIDGKKSESLPYELQMNSSKPLEKRPFDAVYLIDNKNKNGDTYSKLDQIEKMIGLALYTSAGELSHAIDSQMDNFEKVSDGLAVRDKQAWVTGTGLCELMVNPDTLKDIYSLKAASLLVDLMLKDTRTSQDAESRVRTWVDANNIRENEDNDQLLDSLFDLDTIKKYANDVSDESIKNVISNWVLKKVPEPMEVNDIKDARLAELKGKVDATVKSLMGEPGGIPFAKEFLSKLLAEVDEFKREMDEEKKELVDDKAKAEQAKDDAVNRMLKGKGLFTRASKFFPEIDSKVNDLVKKSSDLVRHESAFNFFTALSEYIKEQISKVNEVSLMLEAARDGFGEEISAIENSRNKNPFQIDLTPRLVKDIDPSKDPDIKISVFLEGIGNPAGLFAFIGKKQETISNTILHYAHTLDANKKYDSVTIETLLQEIKQDSEDAYRNIIKKALNKSEVLLQTDDGGFQPNARGTHALDALYIAVKDKDTTILDTDPATKSLIKSVSDAQFANIPNDKSIVFLRQVGVMPAYQVVDVMKYEEEYKELSESMDFHIDLGLERIMEQKKFQLMPSGSDEDDILEVWVKGFIFGLIRHVSSGSQYEIKSKMAGGKAINDFWYPLGTRGTEARADAYERFKTLTRVLKDDLYPQIVSQENAIGYDECKRRYTELLNDKDKYREVSHLCLDLGTLGRPGYERTGDLFEKELNYLQTLVDSFDKR